MDERVGVGRVSLCVLVLGVVMVADCIRNVVVEGCVGVMVDVVGSCSDVVCAIEDVLVCGRELVGVAGDVGDRVCGREVV